MTTFIFSNYGGFKAIVEYFDYNKSSGPDGIKGSIQKEGSNTIPIFIFNI